MSIIDKISELIKKQQQLEEKIDRIVSEKAPVETAQTPSVTPSPKFDLAVYEAQAKEILVAAREEAAKIKVETVRKEAEVGEREKFIAQQRFEIEKRLAELEQLRKDQLQKLEKIASLSREEAKNLIIQSVEKSLSDEIARKIKDAEMAVKAAAEEKAREILVDAMKHGAVDIVPEYSVSTIRLPDEEIKGRIIGKEGRNIRAIEVATKVEVELDETLDIRLSSFDPIRREVAKRALEKLIKDGRIQPQRIEEIVLKTQTEVERVLFEEGEKLCHSLLVYNLHPDLVKMLGRYKFRFSYGQNMIIHTLEETKIGVAIAGELKADLPVVRLACLLHDIGKIVTEEEGNHIQLGVDLLRKYRVPEKVVNCVAEHHEDKPFSSVESTIVWIADAVSGSRPGARYEPHEDYLKRMTDIEDTAKSFAGVLEAVAYQAGREVRVVVQPEKISDNELTVLVDKIAKKLEEEAKWAGQIKVTGIREVRAIGTAR